MSKNSAMNYTVEWDDGELRTNLANVNKQVLKAMAGSALYVAPKAEAWAKSNAPWTDRTSNARTGLSARPQVAGNFVRVIVSHAVPYGIFLEVRWGGKYQIIMPTVNHFGPVAMRMVGRLLKLP